MSYRIAYPVDNGNPDDSFMVIVSRCEAKYHSCKGARVSEKLRKESGASYVFERACEEIMKRYRFEYEQIPMPNNTITPETVIDDGCSDGVACALALHQSSIEPTGPLILISCSLSFQDRQKGLTGNPIGRVTKKDEEAAAKKSLTNKWAAVCRNNALALVLHEDDAKLLSQIVGEPLKLQKDTFEKLLKEKGKTKLVSCKFDQLPVLSESLGIPHFSFLPFDTERTLIEEIKSYREQPYTQDANINHIQKSSSASFLVSTINQPEIKTLIDLENPHSSFKIQLYLANKHSVIQTRDIEMIGNVPERCKIGEIIKLVFKSTEDCYFYLFDIGTSGKVQMLFPNKWYENNFIKADIEYEFPPKNQFIWRLSSPLGVETIKAFATKTKLEALEFIESFVGPFREIQTRDIEFFKISLKDIPDQWTETKYSLIIEDR